MTPGLLLLLDGGVRSTRMLPFAERAALTIGRAPECSLPLDDETASRRHFEIEFHANTVQLVDLGSKQGTFVDGQSRDRAELAPGALIRAGRSLLLYVDDLDAHAEFVGGELPLAGGFWARRLLDFAERFAAADIPLLMLGETGVGKEVAAQVIHRYSNRKGAFHAINCAAIPPELADAELFGHKRGAFSGATETRVGHIEAAANGTLLLDEIGDLPLAIQVKILRVIERREVTTVGSTEVRKVDVRFVAATSRDLDEMVAAGTFRKDLLYRLGGLRIAIPPLRERREEIPWLAFANLDALGSNISAAALERFMLSDYPGNVRELLNALQVAHLQAKHAGASRIEIEHVALAPPPTRAASPSASDKTSAKAPSRAEVEAAMLAENGNVSRAADRLGVHRAQVYRVLRAQGEDPKRFRQDTREVDDEHGSR